MLQAIPSLGLPALPEIELPANADALLAPIPAPVAQGPVPEPIQARRPSFISQHTQLRWKRPGCC
jgi:hypothetical protein